MIEVALLFASVALDMQAPARPGPAPEVEEREIDPYLFCGCPDARRQWDAEFSGIVQDAELRLAPDGKSTLPRQATVFRVVRSSDPNIKGAVKVWHITDPKKCGVSFDYGRQQTIRVRNASDGLETDWCIDPRRTAK